MTRTFGTRPDGTFSDQLTRSSGARFWIPSLDEWIKATYYDPNRFGPEQGGYWRRPGSRDEFLKSGYPSEGGETDAVDQGSTDDPFLPAGSYSSIQSPWGLLDTSGSLRELVEEPGSSMSTRLLMGSRQSDPVWFLADDIKYSGLPFDPQIEGGGLRIATTIPSGSTVFTILSIILISRRKRHE